MAERYGVSRERQDEFALRSHQRAARARDDGKFAEEISPIATTAGEVTADEGIRADLTMAELAAKRPAFRQGGTVTGGNSSPLNDGAAVLVLASERAAAASGQAPMARYAGTAAAGVHPDYMGIGPVPALGKALARAGWQRPPCASASARGSRPSGKPRSGASQRAASHLRADVSPPLGR